MRIEVLYVPGCPNHAAAISSVNEALRTEKMVVLIEEVEVSDAAAAQTLRFPGSPTIRINGVDAEPNEELSLDWRAGSTSGEPRPSQATLRRAIASASRRKEDEAVRKRPFDSRGSRSAIDACLLRASRFPWCAWGWPPQCLGATTAALAAGCCRCVFSGGVYSAPCEEVHVCKAQHREPGDLLDGYCDCAVDCSVPADSCECDRALAL